MKQKTYRKVLLISIVFLIILTPNAIADSNFPFGSVGYNKMFTMFPGEDRSVKLSFFNYGDESIYVDVSVAGDFEIGTSVTPDSFVLENTKKVSSPTSHEWVIVGDEYIKAVPVKVRLSVPENLDEISRNSYNIKVIALARKNNPDIGGITATASQVREYNYRIDIPGNINSTNKNYSSTIKKEQFYREYKKIEREPIEKGEGNINIEDDNEKNTGEDSAETDNEETPTGYFSLNDKNSRDNITFLVLGIMILLIIFVLYRRYK
ncbi:MAG: hypothetical protein ABEK17_01340 [Candidatus Aenigmatarchaeota archaeon]